MTRIVVDLKTGEQTTIDEVLPPQTPPLSEAEKVAAAQSAVDALLGTATEPSALGELLVELAIASGLVPNATAARARLRATAAKALRDAEDRRSGTPGAR